MKYNKKQITFIAIFLSIAILISLSSCALKVNAREFSAGYSRQENSKTEITQEFKSALLEFSFELFKESINKEDNSLISPLSAMLCLSMLANGADGNTKTEFETVLGMDIDSLNRGLYEYTNNLYSGKDCKLNLANSIWFRDINGFEVKENFLQKNADFYNAQIYGAPFDTSTIKDINRWCSSYTDGMIDNIIEGIEAETMMYLINAIVFDAKWEEKYKKDQVLDGIFNNYDGQKSSVKMLSSKENQYFKGGNFVGFAKNYIDNKYSFVALLPDEEVDIFDFVESLNGESWLETWENKVETMVQVKMPEFRYELEIDLKKVLSSMGLGEIFTENANLSKISDTDLFCDKVQQNVFIELNRNGTKAAAITFVSMKNESAPMMEYVTLDRPFVYALVDNSTGLPFFIGAVINL